MNSEAALQHLADAARVPVWIPRPLPVGWVVSGIGWAGDERTGARATAVACSGPSPVGGPGDLIVVAEEPGIGLGARLAGLDAPDPVCSQASPDFKVVASHHPTALWAQRTPPDRSAFVGEAKTVWLEIVLWPARTSLLLLEHVVLADVRDGMGPFLGTFLRASHGWDAGRVGMALAASQIGTVLAQTPAEVEKRVAEVVAVMKGER